ncbi:MAG: hypothetical protein DRJ21_02195 [Candidatus Methanomethylicota archaeon]|uniref:Uncharacterized protein n=1 Tax=Thermoproteota archaeon TaxID=2056631 RepID=A0A497ET02_9CREN|nr:MAG: hypothetical protein DRJ21_02195 [Candidatus Verstraetearchaeota archaeon]
MILSRPPRIKVLEALGCIADGRIKVINENYVKVTSSLGDKTYNVYVDLNRGVAYSDDNGTKYRNYIGYPIIALLMIKGVLPYDKRISEALKGIPWKILNEKYKKYALVEREVLKIARSKGVSSSELMSFVKKVMNKISELKLEKLNSLPLEVYKSP